MNDIERAISEIANIRTQLAASAQFRGIAPKATALTGVLALVVATAQTLWPEILALDVLRYVGVWAAVTVASLLIAASEAIARSRRLHLLVTDTMLNTAARQMLPFGAAGVIITLVICRFSIGSSWLLPGIWQILIALIGFAALPNLPRAIAWAAGWYFLCGSVVLILGGWSGELSPWMMGAPMAIGQFIVALIMYFSEPESSGVHRGRLQS